MAKIQEKLELASHAPKPSYTDKSTGKGPENLHAEQIGSDYLFDNNKISSTATAFGISKLTCFNCWRGVNGLGIGVTGTHGKTYKWTAPAYLYNEENLRKYLGLPVKSEGEKLSDEHKILAGYIENYQGAVIKAIESYAASVQSRKGAQTTEYPSDEEEYELVISNLENNQGKTEEENNDDIGEDENNYSDEDENNYSDEDEDDNVDEYSSNEDNLSDEDYVAEKKRPSQGKASRQDRKRLKLSEKD